MSSNYNIQSKNVFSLFPQYSLEQADNYIKNNTVTTQNTKEDTAEITTKPHSKRKKILFGSTIASMILTAGIIGLVLAKGIHGKNNLTELKLKLSQELKNHEALGLKSLPDKIKYFRKKTVKKVIDIMQAASNFTAIKDRGADKVFRSNKFTGNFAQKCADFFKKITDKTLGKKYNKAEVSLKDLSSLLKQYKISNLEKLSESELSKQITIGNETKILSEWLKELRTKTTSLEELFDKNFSLGGRKARDVKRIKLLSDLPQKIDERFFKNIKNIFNRGNYRAYATEELSKPAQEALKEEILKAKEASTASLNEILSILKGLNGEKIVSDSSYKEYDKLAKKIAKGLKNATGLEIGDYFLKQAEIKVGSATTDVLSVLFPIGASAYAISKGNDKDEKISAVLTTCIPLVGTFAAFVYGTTKMLSGAKNLIFSLVSGGVLSILGNYSDKMYQKYKKAGSIENVVKDEYEKFWTGLETQIQKFEEPENK